MNDLARIIVCTFCISLCSGCADESAYSRADLNEEQMTAVCLIHSFAERNGFLGALESPNYDEIQLLGYDELEYVVEGEVNWDQLLADRENDYTGILYAVSSAPDEDGWYSVYYNTEPFDLCEEANPETGEIIFSTIRFCERSERVVEVQQSELDCSAH